MIRKLLYYFIKRSSEKAHRAYYREYYKAYVARAEASAERKPDRVMHREMRALKRYWGCDPVHYYRYEFWRKDCPLTREQMQAYVPDFFAYYLFYPVSFRDRNALCEDKRLMYSLNEGLGIAQPRELFNIREGGFYDSHLNALAINEVMQRIGACDAARLFVKPTYGVGGKGIRAFERTEDGYRDCKTQECLSEEVLATLSEEDYIVQEGLVQHPLLNAVYPGAINTFRMVTECDGKNSAKVLLSLLRMGSGGGMIDNASSGGLYIGIDPQTGILGKTALRDDRSRYQTHPDTGFRFEGYQVPVWEELTTFACATALKYRELRYVGWDIAYTVDGPVVIEGNNGPSIEILQDHYGGLQQTLDIHDPRQWWFREDYSLKNN